MNRIVHYLLCGLLIIAGPRFTRSADFTYLLTGNAANAQPRHTEGALLLMGGGGLVDVAFRWFIQKAGGGDIVVLKASMERQSSPTLTELICTTPLGAAIRSR